LLLAVLWAPAALATDYYVSLSGDDSNAGTSSSASWKTIAKVNSVGFSAGDRILLEGGQTFGGSVYFDSGDRGTPSNPITITSYGSGAATINAGLADGLFAWNTAGLAISNLIFEGAGAQTNTNAGVNIYNDLPGNVKLGYIRIDAVNVSGFRNGILIGGWNGASGYDNVRVTNTVAYNNQRSGMSTYAAARYGLTNVYVGYSSFHDNLGDPNLTTVDSGNGIVLGEVDGAVIERTVAYNNGTLCPAANGGPVGIWEYDSNNVLIQHSESYSNHTGGKDDGGGFDLDIRSTNSVMQYNYSHDNDGAGFGLYQDSGPVAWKGNIVRYNISENDGRKNGYGAITLWTGGGGFSDAEIFNNTIYVSPDPSRTAHAIRINSDSSGFHFRNNLILATGGMHLLEVPP
jgi:hypothetical protein